MSFTTSTGHFDQLILSAPFSLHGFPAPFQRRFPALLLCLANFCGALFACLQKLEHCASTSSLLRLLAQSSVLPLRGHRRVSHADGHAVFKVRRWTGNKKVATKQTGHAFAFSEGLASRLCSDLKSQKGKLPSPAGTERTSKNM